MKRLLTLLLGGALLCPPATAADGQPRPKAAKVGVLTAYYAAETFELNYMNYPKGQLVWETNDTTNKLVETDGDNYKFVLGEGCEEDCDYILPKAKLYTKTYEMNELTTENIGPAAEFRTEDGLTARIFLADFNGHECRSYDGKPLPKEVTEGLWESYVLSFQSRVPGTYDIYVFEDFVAVQNGTLSLYTTDPDSGVSGFIADLWETPADWQAPSAFDRDGLLQTDLLQNADMPWTASVAYIADLDALYLNGGLYYRVQQ